jgi:hypothetical protein
VAQDDDKVPFQAVGDCAGIVMLLTGWCFVLRFLLAPEDVVKLADSTNNDWGTRRGSSLTAHP